MLNFSSNLHTLAIISLVAMVFVCEACSPTGGNNRANSGGGGDDTSEYVPPGADPKSRCMSLAEPFSPDLRDIEWYFMYFRNRDRNNRYQRLQCSPGKVWNSNVCGCACPNPPPDANLTSSRCSTKVPSTDDDKTKYYVTTPARCGFRAARCSDGKPFSEQTCGCGENCGEKPGNYDNTRKCIKSGVTYAERTDNSAFYYQLGSDDCAKNVDCPVTNGVASYFNNASCSCIPVPADMDTSVSYFNATRTGPFKNDPTKYFTFSEGSLTWSSALTCPNNGGYCKGQCISPPAGWVAANVCTLNGKAYSENSTTVNTYFKPYYYQFNVVTCAYDSKQCPANNDFRKPCGCQCVPAQPADYDFPNRCQVSGSTDYLAPVTGNVTKFYRVDADKCNYDATGLCHGGNGYFDHTSTCCQCIQFPATLNTSTAQTCLSSQKTAGVNNDERQMHYVDQCQIKVKNANGFFCGCQDREPTGLNWNWTRTCTNPTNGFVYAETATTAPTSNYFYFNRTSCSFSSQQTCSQANSVFNRNCSNCQGDASCVPIPSSLNRTSMCIKSGATTHYWADNSNASVYYTSDTNDCTYSTATSCGAIGLKWSASTCSCYCDPDANKPSTYDTTRTCPGAGSTTKAVYTGQAKKWWTFDPATCGYTSTVCTDVAQSFSHLCGCDCFDDQPGNFSTTCTSGPLTRAVQTGNVSRYWETDANRCYYNNKQCNSGEIFKTTCCSCATIPSGVNTASLCTKAGDATRYWADNSNATVYYTSDANDCTYSTATSCGPTGFKWSASTCSCYCDPDVNKPGTYDASKTCPGTASTTKAAYSGEPRKWWIFDPVTTCNYVADECPVGKSFSQPCGCNCVDEQPGNFSSTCPSGPLTRAVQTGNVSRYWETDANRCYYNNNQCNSGGPFKTSCCSCENFASTVKISSSCFGPGNKVPFIGNSTKYYQISPDGCSATEASCSSLFEFYEPECDCRQLFWTRCLNQATCAAECRLAFAESTNPCLSGEIIEFSPLSGGAPHPFGSFLTRCNTQTFTYPLYGGKYALNLDFTWNIRACIGKRVRYWLTYGDIDLYFFDFLAVYDGANINAPAVFQYSPTSYQTSPINPPLVYTGTQTINTVEFFSDNYVTRSGFTFNYSFV